METNQETNEPTQQVKQKNPKRVEAGKKGAAARKTKKAQEVEITKITKDTQEEPVATQHLEEVQITVYKNYIPLCAVVVGIVGLGLYYKYRTAKQPVASHVAKHVSTAKQKEDYDPFIFN